MSESKENNSNIMELELLELTTPGDRKANQDYMAHIIERDYALFIVADGLGGHHAGEKASQFFCQGMLSCARIYGNEIPVNPTKVFKHWINDAINEMEVLFGDDQMVAHAHTTCAVLYLDAYRVMTAHCGDSRVYRLNPTEIVWRTRDHSVPQDLLTIGLITEEELGQHPEQNHLTRSININKEYPVEIKLLPAISENETFVLCSDGFWGHIKPEEFLQLSNLDSDFEDLDKLAKLSVYRAKGNSDNLTVMSVRCKKD
jgi:PPM family protein phosphatase